MSERLTAVEAAEQLGVHVNTVKHWLTQVQIPAEKDSAGRWRFSEEAVAALHAVKQLRDQSRTFDTIRQRIDKAAPSDSLAAEQPAIGDRQAADNAPPTFDGAALAAVVGAALVPQVVEALAQNNDLAEKYARASHLIGRLESDGQHLREQLAEVRQTLAAANEKILLLEAPKPEEPRRRWWQWGPLNNKK
jgi:excisionase family DNA binding protein